MLWQNISLVITAKSGIRRKKGIMTQKINGIYLTESKATGNLKELTTSANIWWRLQQITEQEMFRRRRPAIFISDG